MRNAFIEELCAAARFDEHIWLIAGDVGYGVIDTFQRRFPKRFINAGIAEQNMMGMAAGMASEGKHVFVYSIANFPTWRCAEQIRNDIDYHNLPVTIVSAGGGLTYGQLGYSHHAVQDYALMRSLPNMLIAAPGDPLETRACVRYLLKHPQPSYLRLGKSGERCIHRSVPFIRPGRWLSVYPGIGSEAAIISTGTALEIAEKYRGKQHIFSMPLWGMKYKSRQREQAIKFPSLTTFEDHLEDGGFGSWMLEAILASGNHDSLLNIHVRALNSQVCGMVGNKEFLNETGGLK